MNETLTRYVESMNAFDDIEKGLYGLRSLMQLCMKIPKDRYKALCSTIRRFSNGIDRTHIEHFNKLSMKHFGAGCKEQTVREHRIKS
jgi:hypothetical protein